VPRPSLIITNLSVHAISYTRNLTLRSRQSPPHAPRPESTPTTKSRFVSTAVALVSALVMASKSGARAAAASFCCNSVGFSGAAAVVLSIQSGLVPDPHASTD